MPYMSCTKFYTNTVYNFKRGHAHMNRVARWDDRKSCIKSNVEMICSYKRNQTRSVAYIQNTPCHLL